jgi:hypothetical protein
MVLLLHTYSLSFGLDNIVCFQIALLVLRNERNREHKKDDKNMQRCRWRKGWRLNAKRRADYQRKKLERESNKTVNPQSNQV